MASVCLETFPLERLPLEILSLVMRQLAVSSLLHLRGVNKRFSDLVLGDRRWNLIRYLRQWVGDPEAMRLLMRETNAILVGRSVTRFALMVPWRWEDGVDAAMIVPEDPVLLDRWASFFSGHGYSVQRIDSGDWTQLYVLKESTQGSVGPCSVRICCGKAARCFALECVEVADAAYLSADEAVVFFPRLSGESVPPRLVGNRAWDRDYSVGVRTPYFGRNVASLFTPAYLLAELPWSCVFGPTGTPKWDIETAAKSSVVHLGRGKKGLDSRSSTSSPFQAWQGVSEAQSRQRRVELDRVLTGKLETVRER